MWGTLDRRFQWYVCKTVEHDTTSIKWKFFMPWKMKIIIAWYNFSHFELYNWRIIVFMCLQERKSNFRYSGSRGKSLVLSCLVLSCLVLFCLVLSCLVLSCLVLSCLVLFCLVLSCLVWSCLVIIIMINTPPPCVLFYILRGTSSRTLFFYDIYVHEEIKLP